MYLDTAASLPEKLVLTPVSFAVPDKLSLFAKLITFSSSAEAWASSSPNESNVGDVTDTEETHLSWTTDASYKCTDSSVFGRATDSTELFKDTGSSVGLSLNIFRRFLPPSLFLPSDIVTILSRLSRSSLL